MHSRSAPGTNTLKNRHTRKLFNVLLNYIQAERALDGMPAILRTSFLLLDCADVMYDATTERNEEVIREFASKRKEDHKVGNPILTLLSYRQMHLEVAHWRFFTRVFFTSHVYF